MWIIRKRKRDDENSSSGSTNNNLQKTEADYVLTPLERDKENQKKKNIYYLGEELDATESRKVEYKEGGVLYKKDALITLVEKYGSAFLNSEGGKILAGVNDKGIVKGVYVSPDDYDKIVETINSELGKLRPFVHRSLYSVKTYPVLQTGKKSLFATLKTDKLCIVEFAFSKGIDGELYESGSRHVYLRRDGGVQGPLKPLHILKILLSLSTTIC